MTQLECEKTNVLVSPSTEGEKVTFARRWKVSQPLSDSRSWNVSHCIALGLGMFHGLASHISDNYNHYFVVIS